MFIPTFKPYFQYAQSSLSIIASTHNAHNRTMRRNPIFQFDVSSQILLMKSREHLDFHPVIRVSQRCK